MSFYDAIRVGASGAADFEVERSLRFNGADGPYLERTPSSASNQRTMTFSFWFKRAVNTNFTTVFRSYGNASNRHGIDFVSGGQLRLWGNYNGSVAMTVQPTQVFRDFSAWYHFVLAIDTTQGTSSNRVKMYINGDQITDFATASYPSQNFDFGFNDSNAKTQIGIDGGTGCNFYIAEFHEIDGLQLTPSSFGETNSDTGQWVPIDTSSLTFGTNGFRLKFADNSGTTATTLGKDSSGNGNNFTPNNFSVSAGAGNDSVEDTPTNNFCTMNPLDMNSNLSTKNGNLQVVEGDDWRGIKGTFGVSSGKWYYELKAGNPNIFCGWVADDTTGTNNISTNPQDSNSAMSAGVLIFCDNGKIQLDTGGTGNRVNYSSALSANDVLGCAIDLDNNTAQFYKQGTALGSINISSSKLATKKVLPYFICHPFSNPDYTFNFGQQAFAYTPPTGHKALSSKNLPDPTIKLPNKHFDTVIYTGTGSGNKSITSLNFQPDWVWIKARDVASYHVIADSVRGVGKLLSSNGTEAETDDATTQTAFQAFLSNGFTVGYNVAWYVNGSPSGALQQVAWNWNAGETDSATYTVKVVSDSGNKYRFNDFGTSAVTLDLAEGGTYTFDGSDSSMSSHPFVIGTAANGSVYSTGVTYQLDGASVTYSQYTSGYSSATTRKLIITVPASAPQLYYWCSVHSGMGGAINTNTALGSSNFGGTIQSRVKANTTAGFSITLYTGTGSAGATVGHGLGVTPNVIIIKNRTDQNSAFWAVYHSSAFNSASDPNLLYLNEDDAAADDTNVFGTSVTINSTKFSLGDYNGSNGNGDNMVAYCFSEVAGYSKFGSYTGNGSSDGTFVFLGFRPAWVMIKKFSGTSRWQINDIKRNPENVTDALLFAEDVIAESASSSHNVDLLSNGFKHRNTEGELNGNGEEFIYLAFAESPFKNSRAR